MTTGTASFDYGPGEAMVIAADVPTTSQITEASQRFPYYALVLELDWLSCASCRRPGRQGRMRRPRWYRTDERRCYGCRLPAGKAV